MNMNRYIIKSQTVTIISAEYIGDYSIMIHFEDGLEQLVDFKGFLDKSKHPSIAKYLREDLFKSFRILNGNLNWNDYDMIFPVWDLYNGVITTK